MVLRRNFWFPDKHFRKYGNSSIFNDLRLESFRWCFCVFWWQILQHLEIKFYGNIDSLTEIFEISENKLSMRLAKTSPAGFCNYYVDQSIYNGVHRAVDCFWKLTLNCIWSNFSTNLFLVSFLWLGWEKKILTLLRSATLVCWSRELLGNQHRWSFDVVGWKYHVLRPEADKLNAKWMRT